MTPTNLEGSLYASEIDDDVVMLFDLIKASGHTLGLSSTSFTYKSPFVRVSGSEIVGEEAIRRHFGLADSAPRR